MSAALDPVLSWPKQEPTFTELRTFLVAWGNRLCGMTWGYVHHRPSTPGFRDYLDAVARMQLTHDVIVLLDALHTEDPKHAEDVARRLWNAADAGDSYGEWFWEWGNALGIDPEKLYQDGKAHAEESDR